MGATLELQPLGSGVRATTKSRRSQEFVTPLLDRFFFSSVTMQTTFERTLQGAQAAADAGRVGEWVHAFLSSGLGANPPMAIGLRKQQRWWIGPVLIPLASLTRICGPEPEMEYHISR